MIRTMSRIRARPGCESAVESAWQTVSGQIGRLAGNLLHDLLLDVNDPRSFIVVTEWSDSFALQDYENGPVAARFADAVRPLCAAPGAGGYRVMCGPEGAIGLEDSEATTICVDVEVNVPASRLPEFERGYAEVAVRMAGVPGYLREELLWKPGSDAYHIFAEWSSEAEFFSWIGNPAHAEEEAGPIAPFLLQFRRRLFHLQAQDSFERARSG